MRQVIRRFLKHLEAEKNASVTTIESYQYDLHKFDAYLVKRLGNRFLPGDVTRDHIRDYLMWFSEVGHQRPNGPSHVRGRSQSSGHSSNTPIVQVY
jgi:site-specific recombinase XerD